MTVSTSLLVFERIGDFDPGEVVLLFCRIFIFNEGLVCSKLVSTEYSQNTVVVLVWDIHCSWSTSGGDSHPQSLGTDGYDFYLGLR